jgi:FMN phosphatase YigB (HAD superfamily)
MVKLKDLLLEKKLRVFDFDDTLVKSNSKVFLVRNGKRKEMTPGEFAIYKKKPGDEFDFSEFDRVIEPKQIKAMFKVFKNIYKASGSRRLTILTARAAYKPVRKFLKDVGFTDVYVVALGDANPQKKADWIESQIKKGYDDILFLDDSPKNVSAVKKLKQKYPKIKMDARVVNYG